MTAARAAEMEIEMKAIVRRVTPDVAREWLKKNTMNRPMSQLHIKALAAAMLAHEWRDNGDTIVFDVSGKLVDGQHRLHALIAAGVSLDMLIVEGATVDAFMTKDIGRRRSCADALSIEGFASTSRLAATANLIDRYRTGRMVNRIGYTVSHVVALVKAEPSIVESLNRVHAARKFVTISVAAAAYHLWAEVDREMADELMNQIIDGEGLTRGDPAFALRERLIKNAAAQRKVTSIEMFAFFIKAWNATRSGERISNLVFRMFGESPESFPLIRSA